MSRKEFVKHFEDGIWTMDKLASQLKINPAEMTGYPRQQMTVLVRLYQNGRARLKDIARREHVSAPNLCAAFRKLERDGLILRVVDENDRRNTWYSVTPSGAEKAKQAMEVFRTGIGMLFSQITRDDEKRLTDAMRTINEILNKLELNNA